MREYRTAVQYSLTKRRRMKTKSVTKIILEFLLNFTEDLTEIAFNRNAAWKILYQIDREYEWTQSKLGRWIRDLQNEGYIEVKNNQSSESIILTNKGKLKVIESMSSKIKDDKRNRFISFDIPESEKYKRNGFRSAIKRIGFKQLQQSLWVINKDVSDLVELAEVEYEVTDYVVYILSEKSDADQYIEKLSKTLIERKSNGRSK